MLWQKPYQWAREVSVLAALFRDWPVAVRHHYELFLPSPPPSPVVTFHLRSGEVFTVDPGWIDVTVLKSIWGDRIYETFPGFAPEPGWTMLDLGAHKGSFTIRAARAGATVWAVEPEAHNLDLLRANLARNDVGDRVQVWVGAVAGEGGQGWLLRRDSWSHGLEPHPEDPDAVERDAVELVGLDELVAAAGPRVDLMKLDVEGAELAALRGASAETMGRVRRVVLEYHPVAGKPAEAVGQELAARLEGHGFRCRLIPWNLLFADRPDV